MTDEQFTQLMTVLEAIRDRLTPTSKPVQAVTQAAWLEEVAAQPVYRALNVRGEFDKMVQWCRVHQKEPTKRRFINWLNRTVDDQVPAATRPTVTPKPAPVPDGVPPPPEVLALLNRVAGNIGQ